jgi:hypothetical protein
MFTMLKDGVDGYDLGVIESAQFALTPRGEIMRRRADEAGTYGGWRWECSASHVLRAPVSVFPGELRTAIELVLVARSAC